MILSISHNSDNDFRDALVQPRAQQFERVCRTPITSHRDEIDRVSALPRLTQSPLPLLWMGFLKSNSANYSSLSPLPHLSEEFPFLLTWSLICYPSVYRLTLTLHQPFEILFIDTGNKTTFVEMVFRKRKPLQTPFTMGDCCCADRSVMKSIPVVPPSASSQCRWRWIDIFLCDRTSHAW